jgi:hypothetical protein
LEILPASLPLLVKARTEDIMSSSHEIFLELLLLLIVLLLFFVVVILSSINGRLTPVTQEVDRRRRYEDWSYRTLVSPYGTILAGDGRLLLL